jgi:uncharacterized protein
MAAMTSATASRRGFGVELLGAILVAALLLRGPLSGFLDGQALRTWATVFVSISFQALPFLALGVIVSGSIAAFVTPAAMRRALPRSPVLAVPVAGLAGMALPVCECGSVPIAGRLMAGGAGPAAAVTFLLAAPAINPIVLAATWVAFPGQPMMVLGRFVASLVAAVLMGWLWLRFGRDEWVARALRRPPHEGARLEVFRATAVHDLLHAGGYLVVGAMAAATLNVVVPRTILDSVAGNAVTAVAAMALLAVVLSICSEADAFVAASLTQFSLTSRLVFLVVGPMVDLKLIALQAGTFGRGFVTRFAPVTLVVSVSSAVAFGLVVW